MNQILLIAKDKSVYDYSYKIAKGNDLYKDIISEIIIHLSELEDEKFNKINDLKSYVCKMIYFSWNSPTSPFFRKFRNDRDFLIKDVFTYDEEIETKEESKYIDIKNFKTELGEIENRISEKRYPSEIKLFELYLELKSYRAVAKLVGIPASSVHHQVNRVIEEMKNKI